MSTDANFEIVNKILNWNLIQKISEISIPSIYIKNLFESILSFL